MGKLEVAKFWRDINCLYPFYDVDGGNYTKVLLEGGRGLVDKRKTKTVLNEVAKYFTQDLAEIRKKYGSYLNRQKAIPIPLHAELVLIAVKVRVPEQKDEGAIAYINSEKVKLLRDLKDEAEFKTELVFNDESSLKTIPNSLRIKALLQDAQLVKNSYLTIYRSQGGDVSKIRESLTTFIELLQKSI